MMKKNSLFEARKRTVSNEAKEFVDLSFKIVDRIYDILQEKGMSQKDLAEKLGKSEAEISKWMRGTHNFTISTIIKLESALGASILSVYNNAPQPKQQEGQTVFQLLPIILPSFSTPTSLNKTDKYEGSCFMSNLNN
ncbi:helix-turn-helix domain-containing protein [Phocaeicola plebeius]|uniref:helix-turn-helix domain-containing protein n=1 Tax=Phocaeicola plebeius TaxID=310297 RepID=UPI003AB7BCA1